MKDINKKLIEYAEEGNIDIVKLLLSNGADVNAKNNNGETALILASLMGHTDIVKLLKEYEDIITINGKKYKRVN